MDGYPVGRCGGGIWFAGPEGGRFPPVGAAVAPALGEPSRRLQTLSRSVTPFHPADRLREVSLIATLADGTQMGRRHAIGPLDDGRRRGTDVTSVAASPRPAAAWAGVIAIVGEQRVEIPVDLAKFESSYKTPDYVRDVNPVLSRLGCNAGTCHGAAKGKNGFKLSLRGYDRSSTSGP